MKILTLNGSPRGAASNTFQLTQAFLGGLRQELESPLIVKTRMINELNLSPCRGCFRCWTATPGVCVIPDAMAEVLDEMRSSDLILWSFPLYYFGMPGPVKTLLDRCLPLNLPWMERDADGRPVHPPGVIRMPRMKSILISTCGFTTIENNYEALIRQLIWPSAPVLNTMSQGELFAHPELRRQTSAYLAQVTQAGQEYGRIQSTGFEAAFFYTLSRAGAEGHLYLPREELLERAAALLGLDTGILDKHLMDLSIDRKIVLKEQKKGDGESNVIVYSSQSYFLELNTARMLQELNIVCESRRRCGGKTIAALEASDGISLDESRSGGSRRRAERADDSHRRPGHRKDYYYQYHDPIFLRQRTWRLPLPHPPVGLPNG